MSPAPHVIHLVISLAPGGLERLVVDWTNARNRLYPGSTRICCLDECGALASQVDAEAVICLGAKRGRKPFDLAAVRRLRSLLTPVSSSCSAKLERPGNQRPGDPVLPLTEGQLHVEIQKCADPCSRPSVRGGVAEACGNAGGADPCSRPSVRGGVAEASGCHPTIVLHSHNAAAWQYGVLAGIGNGIRHIHTEHGTNPHTAGWVNRLRNALLWRLTDAVVVVAENVADQVSRLQRIPRSSLHVIPNGIKSASWDNNARPPTGIIGSVGRLAKVKGYDRLISAFAQIGSKTNNQLSLLLVGDGPERAALEEQARKLGIADRVTFAGYQEDPRPYYGMMDLFVLPSLSEGLSISLLEAMAAGVPVAVTDVGENRVVLDDGKAGFLLPEKEASWAVLIQDALTDPTRMEKIALARDRVRTWYSQETTLEGYERLYQETEAAPPASRTATCENTGRIAQCSRPSARGGEAEGDATGNAGLKADTPASCTAPHRGAATCENTRRIAQCSRPSARGGEAGGDATGNTGCGIG